jgi:cell division transport system permease protein
VKGYGLFFYVAEAFRGLRANSLVNLLALGTITMIMLIVGFFLLVFFNLQASVQIMGERLEVSVYLKDGLSEPEKDFLLSRLKAEPGIRKVTYLSKTQALEVLKEAERAGGPAGRAGREPSS